MVIFFLFSSFNLDFLNFLVCSCFILAVFVVVVVVVVWFACEVLSLT